MTKTISVALAAMVAASMAGAAFADTIATGGEKGTGTDIRWVKNAAGTGGHLYSVLGSSTSAVAAMVPYTFDFNIAPLDTLIGTLGNGNNVKLVLDASSTNSPATGSGISQQQTGLNGTLKLTYTGVTPLAGCIHANCTNLLTATFTDAWLVGGGAPQPGQRSSTISFTAFNDPTVPAASVSFTSDFINFTHYTDQAFNLALASPTTITHTAGKALNTFNASSAGTFEATYVPEPASWALMLLGFGGLGAMLRRRRAMAFA